MKKYVPWFAAPMIGVLFLSISVGACDAFNAAACHGAVGLAEEHADALACAEWLPFVQNNIGTIDYVEVRRLKSNSEGEVTGRAHCRSCRVQVAALQSTGPLGLQTAKRSSLEVASILVHEAAHLADRCEHGEAPAQEAEAAFIFDFIIRCAGR